MRGLLSRRLVLVVLGAGVLIALSNTAEAEPAAELQSTLVARSWQAPPEGLDCPAGLIDRRDVVAHPDHRSDTTNMTALSVDIVDRYGDPITASAGHSFWVRITFEYVNPTCEDYAIRRTVNGWSNTAPEGNWGCGYSGSTWWYHYWGPWVMHHGGIYSTTVTLDANNAIAESNEFDNTLTIDFPVSGDVTEEWDLVHAEAGVQLLGDGTDVIVGTMDDAFDYIHPWFAGTDSVGRPRLVASHQNALGLGGSPVNSLHATGVMGIVLARGTNVGDVTGLAPDARYVTAEFINRAEIPGHPVMHVLDAVGFLVDHDVDVINMSWSWWSGTGAASESGETAWTNLMADYLAYDRNIVCVAAVNQLDAYVRPTAPGSSRNVITVGGLDDSLERAWGQQDYGPTLDGRCKPDLLGNDSANAVTSNPHWRNGIPAAEGWCGTSFATPFVTGAVAQMLDYARHHGQNEDHRVIKAVIMNSAAKALDDDGSSWSHSETVPLDNQQGTGVLDLERVHAMYSAGQQAAGTVVVPGYDFAMIVGTAAEPPSGGEVVYVLGCPVAFQAELEATLVWDRHALWYDANDNDVIDSSDTFYHDYWDAQDNLDLTLYRDGVPVASSCSTIDNVEHIYVPDAPQGLYQLVVQRLAVPNSGADEDFALAWDSTVSWAFPDVDHDMDVDLADFARFQRCCHTSTAECLEDFDFNRSGNVDLGEFAVIYATMIGVAP